MRASFVGLSIAISLAATPASALSVSQVGAAGLPGTAGSAGNPGTDGLDGTAGADVASDTTPTSSETADAPRDLNGMLSSKTALLGGGMAAAVGFPSTATRPRTLSDRPPARKVARRR